MIPRPRRLIGNQVRQRHGRRTGVTLVELLIASALAGAVAGMVVLLYIGVWRNFLDARARAERLGRLAGATATIAADVRAARGVLTAIPGRLDLWAADKNADGFAQADEITEYRIEEGEAGRRLAREANGTRTILIEGLTGATWAADLPPPDSRRLWIEIRIEGDPAPFVTSLALRNAETGP